MTKEQHEILYQIKNDTYFLVRKYNDLVEQFNQHNMSENDASDYNTPKLIAFEMLDNSGGIISVEPEGAYDFVSKLDY